MSWINSHNPNQVVVPYFPPPADSVSLYQQRKKIEEAMSATSISTGLVRDTPDVRTAMEAWNDIVKKTNSSRDIPKKRSLSYKGLTFFPQLKDDSMEFFEEKEIKEEEIQLLEITFPEEHVKLKKAWMDVYLLKIASEAFDN